VAIVKKCEEKMDKLVSFRQYKRVSFEEGMF